MEPETQKLINEWPDLSPEQAKLIFVRQSAQEAYEQGKIQEATNSILKEVTEIATCASMDINQIAEHIGNLEKVRNYLAAFTQGLMKAHASKVEPEIKAKRAKERREKLAQKVASKDSKVNSLIQMAISGAITTNEEPKKNVVTKTKCESCGLEVYSLKFHKCK